MLPDRGDLAVEVMVQDVDHGFRRHAIGQRGEAAQVGQPDRGIHGLGMAAPDLATENALAGAIADIGVEQARSGAAQRHDFDHPRQRLHEAPQRRQLFIREPARLLGGPARSVDGAADKGQRQRDIVRDALGAQLVDDRKALARGIVDAGPNFQPLLEHDFQRAGVKIRRLQNIEIDRAEFDLGARLPDEIAPVDVGMQRADEDPDTPERQASRDHPFAGFRHEPARAGRRSPAVDQPVGQLLAVLDASMAPVFAVQRRETSRLASFVSMPWKQLRYVRSCRDPASELR